MHTSKMAGNNGKCLAVAVVKDGKVIFKKGYGVRELGKPDGVNTETLFSIGSTTKAMTAACMGMLVDEGKVKWDDLVITYLPEYQLYDPFVTRELRIRDLFIHNSGVGNADFVWTVMDISPEEILKKMRQVFEQRCGNALAGCAVLGSALVVEHAHDTALAGTLDRHAVLGRAAV